MNINLCYNRLLEKVLYYPGDEMSQYYPPRGPLYPPEQNPETYYEDADYEYEENGWGGRNNTLQTALAFVGGGCLVFVCMSFCVLLGAALWVLDPTATAAVPPEGGDIGLSFDEPAFPDESVVNEQGAQLKILDVNRNAALESVTPVEGREIVIVTIELVNLGSEDISFNERDFLLVNGLEEAYEPMVGAINIRDGALGRGTLPPNEGLEGRLVYEIIANELDLRLVWDPAERDVQPRYIYLE
jgi:hypothetical protein